MKKIKYVDQFSAREVKMTKKEKLALQREFPNVFRAIKVENNQK